MKAGSNAFFDALAFFSLPHYFSCSAAREWTPAEPEG
jgi:hypothetical protein